MTSRAVFSSAGCRHSIAANHTATTAAATSVDDFSCASVGLQCHGCGCKGCGLHAKGVRLEQCGSGLRSDCKQQCIGNRSLPRAASVAHALCEPWLLLSIGTRKCRAAATVPAHPAVLRSGGCTARHRNPLPRPLHSPSCLQTRKWQLRERRARV